MSPRQNNSNPYDRHSLNELKNLRDSERWRKIQTERIPSMRLSLDSKKCFLSEVIKTDFFSKKQEKNILKHLAISLAELHNRGIIHGALHPGNILLDRENPEIVKLCEINPVNSAYNLNISSKPNDVLSLAIVYHQILHKSHPFQDEILTQKSLLKGPANLKFSAQNSVLISQMLACSPKNRILSKNILKNTFFWSQRKIKSFLKFALRSSGCQKIQQKLSFHHAIVLECKDWRVEANKKSLKIPGKIGLKNFRNDCLGLLKAIVYSIQFSKMPLEWENWNSAFPNLLPHLYATLETGNDSAFFYSNPSKINFHSVLGIDINFSSNITTSSKVRKKNSVKLKSLRNRA